MQPKSNCSATQTITNVKVYLLVAMPFGNVCWLLPCVNVSMLQAMLQFISQERSHVPRPNPTRFSEHLLIVEGKVEEELRGQLKGDWRPCNIESFFADGQQWQWPALIDQEGQGEEAPGAQEARIAEHLHLHL